MSNFEREQAAKQWVDDYRRLMGVEPDFIPDTIADRHPKQMRLATTAGHDNPWYNGKRKIAADTEFHNEWLCLPYTSPEQGENG